MSGEHDMFKMGGLRKKLPVIFWTFLFGSAALAAIPIVTAGFYSKDQILFFSLASTQGSIWLWIAGFVGAFITAIYTFRMVFTTFYGEQKKKVSYYPKASIKLPLIILGILSLIAGFIEIPHAWGHFTPFSDFVNNALPSVQLAAGMESKEMMLQIVTAVVALLGVFIAYRIYVKKPKVAYNMKSRGLGKAIYHFFYLGWMFDQLYDIFIVKLVVFFSKIDKRDFIDWLYEGVGTLNLGFNKIFSRTQNGFLRLYICGIAFGAALVLTIILFL